MESLRVGALINDVDINTFHFSDLPNNEKLDKLKEIVAKTKNNTNTLYAFTGDEDLNDMSDYIEKIVKETNKRSIGHFFARNSYMFVFFDGILLIISVYKEGAQFWGNYLGRKRENKCCVCLTENLQFFQSSTCLKGCAAVVCGMCICTLPHGIYCPLCREKDAFSYFMWDPVVDEAFPPPGRS